MSGRSRKKNSVKNDSSAGITNANGSAMADQSTTANTVDNNTDTTTTATTEQSMVKPNNTQVTQREQFEATVMASLEKLLAGQEQLKSDLDTFKKDITKSVEFQGEEIDELKENTDKMATQLNNACQNITRHSNHIGKLWEEVNKSERFSRRNNFRVVGYPESEGENVIEIVKDILITKFDFDDIEIERAHRDGRVRHYSGSLKKPRHILIRLLRYGDKVRIMKGWRQCLKTESFRITDDLTKVDLEEKQKWKEEVAELYKRGTKLRFSGGIWRDNAGKRAPFYKHTGNPFVEITEGQMDIEKGTWIPSKNAE